MRWGPARSKQGAIYPRTCVRLYTVHWGVLAAQAYGHGWDAQVMGSISWSTAGVVAAGSVVFPAIVRFIPILQKPKVRSLVLKIALILAGVIIPLAAIMLFYLAFDFGGLRRSDNHFIGLVILDVFFAFVAFGILNVNLTGPHRLYRDQLARTFVQEREDDDRPVYLKDINRSNSAPYHLINATVNLPSSTDQALRERRSDFFLFSREYCGAPSIGYQRTPDWKTNGEDADLATAMAVSGAAASSYMGLGSMPSLTALLTFLNVRLGF